MESNQDALKTLAGVSGKQEVEASMDADQVDQNTQEYLSKVKGRRVMDWLPQHIDIDSSVREDGMVRIELLTSGREGVAFSVNPTVHPLTVVSHLEACLKALFRHSNTKLDMQAQREEGKA